MDNQELLSQVAGLIREQTQVFSEQLSGINGRLDGMDKRLDAMDNEIRGVGLDIENKITKRIDSLFDGYKLTHEKQWEQDRVIEFLQTKMEEMQLRLLALENKIA